MKRGFLKAIAAIIIALLLLAYWGVDLRKFLDWLYEFYERAVVFFESIKN